MKYKSAKTAASWWATRFKILLNHFGNNDIFAKCKVEEFQILIEQTLNKKLNKGEYSIELIWTEGLLKKIKNKLKIDPEIGKETFYDFSMVVDPDLVEIHIKDKNHNFYTIYDESTEKDKSF